MITATHLGWSSTESATMNASSVWNWRSTATARAARMPGKILNVANENAQNLYIKSDGSLDCGMELVTHPMTLQYHMEQMPWKNVLRKAVGLGYLSHRTTTCGLHVHISRAAFGETEQEQELSIARLLTLSKSSGPSCCDSPGVPSGRSTAGQHGTA